MLNLHVELVLQSVATLTRFGFIEKHLPKGDLIQFDERETTERLCLLYDSNLAALLMIGNLSVGLKQHAVQAACLT